MKHKNTPFLALMSAFLMFVACSKIPDLTEPPPIPNGVFPSAIADYRLKEAPTFMEDRAKSCRCGSFRAEYEKGKNPIYYEVYLNFKTADVAREYFKAYKKSLPTSDRIVTFQETESRFVAIGKNNDQIHVVKLEGTSVIDVWNYLRSADLINFENNLPYAALGMTSLVQQSADGLKVPLLDSAEKVPVLAILDEFNSDREAAITKYNDKRLLLSAVVSDVGTTDLGNPFISVQKPGTKVAMDTIVALEFSKTQADEIAKLKKGDTVQFTGKPALKTNLPGVNIKNCLLEQK